MIYSSVDFRSFNLSPNMLTIEPASTNRIPKIRFIVIASCRTEKAMMGAKIGLTKKVMEAVDGPERSIAFK